MQHVGRKLNTAPKINWNFNLKPESGWSRCYGTCLALWNIYSTLQWVYLAQKPGIQYIVVYALSRQTWVYVHRFRTVRGSFAILILGTMLHSEPCHPSGFPVRYTGFETGTIAICERHSEAAIVGMLYSNLRKLFLFRLCIRKIMYFTVTKKYLNNNLYCVGCDFSC